MKAVVERFFRSQSEQISSVFHRIASILKTPKGINTNPWDRFTPIRGLEKMGKWDIIITELIINGSNRLSLLEMHFLKIRHSLKEKYYSFLLFNALLKRAKIQKYNYGGNLMKKLFSLIICVALLFSITFSGTAFAATVYETESNDSTGTANTISAGDTVFGKISFDKDNDYYKLRLTASASTTFSLSNIPSGCDYDLILYDANGSIIGSSTAFGNTSEKITQTLSAGLYYINVKGYSGTSSSNYKLTVSGSGSTTPTTPPVHGGGCLRIQRYP